MCWGLKNNAGVHLIQVTSGLILDFLYSKTTKKLLANLEAGYVSYDTSPEHDYCDICTRHVIKWWLKIYDKRNITEYNSNTNTVRDDC